MKIFITDSSGIISSALIGHLISKGHSIYCNEPTLPKTEPPLFSLPPGLNSFIKKSPLDAVIYPGNDIIPGKKWNASKAAKTYDDRILMTKHLSEHLANLKVKPKVFIVFSSTGYYGDREDRTLVETSFVGDGLHAEKCRQLEIATNPARLAGIRVVLLRTARIVGIHGDPFLSLYLPNQKYFNGIWGSGKQYVSWISTQDAVSGIEHILKIDDIIGPVNLTSPTPLTNLDFTNILYPEERRLLTRTTPAFMVRHVFDAITSSVLLSSSRVSPRRLLVAGFKFQHSTLEDILEAPSRAQISPN